MNYYDFASKKTTLILGLICLIFLIMIAKAFTYIPKESVNDSNKVIQESIDSKQMLDESNKDSENTQEEFNNDDSKESIEPEHMENPDLGERLDENRLRVEERSEDIQNGERNPENMENSSEELVAADPIEDAFNVARDYFNDNKYQEAVEEYKKILSMTSDVKYQARSYEGIAIVYATNKKYGTALSYAQKAFNMYPSTTREVLLARLYYKTGNIDKATQRINNVLKRDFIADR